MALPPLPDGTNAVITDLTNVNGTVTVTFQVTWPDGSTALWFVELTQTVLAKAGVLGSAGKSK